MDLLDHLLLNSQINKCKNMIEEFLINRKEKDTKPLTITKLPSRYRVATPKSSPRSSSP